MPIKAGYKYPVGIKEWQNLRATETDVEAWLAKGMTGVGVLCTNVTAVDIDVYDEEVSQKLASFCRDCLGPAPERVGQYPKRLLLYRNTAGGQPKISSRAFKDGKGRTNRVEVLGQGQQFVAYGIHPTTNEPYRWVNAEFFEMTLDDLPVAKSEGH